MRWLAHVLAVGQASYNCMGQNPVGDRGELRRSRENSPVRLAPQTPEGLAELSELLGRRLTAMPSTYWPPPVTHDRTPPALKNERPSRSWPGTINSEAERC
jgi:hypothetical protein